MQSDAESRRHRTSATMSLNDTIPTGDRRKRNEAKKVNGRGCIITIGTREIYSAVRRSRIIVTSRRVPSRGPPLYANKSGTWCVIVANFLVEKRAIDFSIWIK